MVDRLLDIQYIATLSRNDTHDIDQPKSSDELRMTNPSALTKHIQWHSSDRFGEDKYVRRPPDSVIKNCCDDVIGRHREGCFTNDWPLA